MSGVNPGNKGIIPNVVVLVTQKLPKDVDGHDPQTGICLDFKDSQNGFV